MKKNFMQKFTSIVIIVILLQVMQFINGCGKSADDLYTEGKALIINEDTSDKGLQNLILFEEKFPQESRTPEVVLTIASHYHSRQNYNEAIRAFERLIEKYPQSQEAYKGKFLLGYIYFDELNDTERATHIFKDFIKTYPDSELASSAKILLKNINIPVEEWSIVKELELTQQNEINSHASETGK